MSTSISRFILVTLALILHLIQTQINPTTTNSSGTFYVASDYVNSGQFFRSGSITCSGSYCHILCDASRGCQHLTVDATSPSTALVIQCLVHDNACAYAVINADTAKSVQLSCELTLSTDSSCRSLKLHANNVQNDVNIVCGAYSCQYADFHASNIGGSLTMLCYGARACDNVEIYCPKDVSCDINCLEHIEGSCYNTQIYIATSETDKVSLNCSNAPEPTCYSTDIVCQDTGLSTPLIFSNSSWECGFDSDCCPRIGSITCSNGGSCQIDCDMQPCNYHDIVATSAASLTLDCGTNGCQYARIYCPIADSTSCHVQCTAPYACKSVYIEHVTHLIHELIVDCISLYACQYMELQSHSDEITQLRLNCSAQYSCQNLSVFLSSSTVKEASMACVADRSCQYARVNLTTGAAANLNFICVTTKPQYSCMEAHFNIFVDNNDGRNTSNVSFLCDSYDCYGATLNISHFYWIDMNCAGSYACLNSVVDVRTSQHVSVKCSGFNGCYKARVYCPIQGVCDFGCLGYDGCSTMTAEITNSDYDELNIDCNSPIYGCDETLIYCIDSEDHSKLLWSTYYQSMVCYGSCCPSSFVQPPDPSNPISYAPTQIPTVTPSKIVTTPPSPIPTTPPSKTPTNDPSGIPSIAPSEIPTDIPSKVATATPSKIPTDVPSKMPTNAPSKIPTDVPSKMPTNAPSKMPTDVPSKIPSNSPFPVLIDTVFTSTKTKEDNDDAFDRVQSNDAATTAIVIVFSLLLVFIVVGVVLYFKKLTNEIGILKEFVVTLQSNNNGNVEMNQHLNVHQQPLDFLSGVIDKNNNDDDIVDEINNTAGAIGENDDSLSS
eukprot:70944_1